jgi:hypothetical protein
MGVPVEEPVEEPVDEPVRGPLHDVYSNDANKEND